jgi:anti-anti-sigma factor
MTQIVKEGGKTIVKTGERIDTLNATQFEREVEAILEKGIDLEFDCTNLQYISSSGLRVIQEMMRIVTRKLNGQIKVTHVSASIFKIFYMTGFTRIITIEK